MTGNAPGTNAQDTYEFTNTNKWDTRQLVTMALMCAIGVLLSFVEFPLLPGVTWLKYDASAMPAMVCGFAFGPAAGLAVGVVGAVIHGILMADFSGAIMNILVVTGFILPAALVYRRSRTFKSGVVGLVLSAITATVMAILGNLVITPMWLGVPLDAVGVDENGAPVVYQKTTDAEGNVTFVPVPVTTGMETDLSVEVSGEGLTEGMELRSLADPEAMQ